MSLMKRVKYIISLKTESISPVCATCVYIACKDHGLSGSLSYVLKFLKIWSFLLWLHTSNMANNLAFSFYRDTDSDSSLVAGKACFLQISWRGSDKVNVVEILKRCFFLGHFYYNMK